ncbi:calpain-13-like [Pseudonaja textilis]|uniref:calpain-13-like n=1 Tax=Pseudonaja textilis TaxID=8673 RepID=UPI000EA86497|nr:calpain-13-like [Pseudonaja textilis]
MEILLISNSMSFNPNEQNQATEGSPAFPLQFNNQDFVKLQNYCLHQGLLFEDDTFPANGHSIGLNLFPQEKLRKIQWLRPNELVRNPRLFVDGISRFDILQGQKIGNCWVLAALGALTQQQRFLKNMIPTDQGFNHTYAGIFHFQFWHFGSWVDVVIDDRLPFIDGNYLSVHPRSKNEFWPSLLEKAYAKLHGSYEKLHYGFISEAFVDLTGGVQLTFNLGSPTDHLFEIMKTAASSGCLMACSSPEMKKTGRQVLENGIVQQHVYAVIDAREVPYMDGKELLIKLWNPWGTVEWNGAWSDHSMEWDRVPQSFKDKFYVNRADGEFWISFEDLKDNFSFLSVCNNLPTFLDFGKENNTSWSVVSYFNQLSPEGSNYRRDALSRNHQYFIKVPEFVMKYNVVVALMQRPDNISRTLANIGFQIKKGRTIVHDTQLNKIRDITIPYQLKAGDYIIIPMASPQNQKLKFLLRIFLRSQGNIREPSNEFSSEMTKDMLFWNPDNYESVFFRYAYQNSYLDASQLQRILNDVLLKDLMAGLGTGDGFSFDSCKSLLALMDINANGKLSLQEFKRLWGAFKKYEDIFGREDENNSGFLTISNLQRIVQETGLYVSDKVLHLLVLRYGDSTQRINFPDFVCCMFRLETMSKAFLNLSKNRGSICFTEDEWMTMIMYC